MAFPSPPWHLRGDMWLSLFAVRAGTAPVPAGLYGVAFVTYRDGGVLTYQELLVARAVRSGAIPRMTVTDMWVDSEVSREGGRSLWALPKEIGELHVREQRLGPVARSAWSSHIGGTPLAAATFVGAPGAALRTPFTATAEQEREDGSVVLTRARGTARTLPCGAAWRFGTDGPLAWMRGRRPVAGFLLSDFRMTFG